MRKQRPRESAVTNYFLFALYAASLITIICKSLQIWKIERLMNAESIHSRWLIPLYNLCNRKLALQALSAINLYV